MSDHDRSNAPAETRRPDGMGPGRGGFGRGGPGGGHMGMPVVKAKDFKGSFKRLLGLLSPHGAGIIAVFALAIGATAFSIVGPKRLGNATTLLFKGIVDRMRGVPGASVDSGGILRILLWVAALYAVSAVFQYIQQYIMAGIAQKTVFGMRKDVSEKLSRLPLGFFDGRPHGDILSRVTNDIDNISTTLQQSLSQMVSSLATVIGVLVMMLSISPLLTVIGVLSLPLSFVFIAAITKRSKAYFAGQQKALGELSGHVEEMFSGHVVVKAFGREKASLETFERINTRLYESGWKAQFISGLIMPLMNFVNNIGYVAVCVAGGILVTKKSIEIGDIQAFIQYLRQFGQPIVQTANIANVIQSAVASAERVFELMDESEELPDRIDAAGLSEARGEVCFEGVDFSYRDDAKLIEDMNLHADSGEIVAIVGPTGAGKTTLVNLLMRFYETKKGRITLDGIDIRDLRRQDLRKSLGMVLQDAWLFSGSVYDNIAYGREGATREAVIAAAKAAHADHFIRTLPEGYETILNEEASNISQGQKQLVTIARAILADPAVLILDEATSSVDTRTEKYIQNAMLELMKARTSFVIAHRLSTIRGAHHILVMNEGKVVEQGSFDELLARCGFFAELYKAQFAGAAEGCA